MGRIKVGVGLSREAETRVAAEQAVRAALEEAGLHRASWALCFFTARHLSAADVVRDVVLREAECRALSGCSAMGVLGRDAELDDGPGLAVMVGDSDAMGALSSLLPADGGGLHRFGPAERTDDGAAALLLMLPDSFQVDNTAIPPTVHHALPDTPVFGAGATDDGHVGLSLQVGMEGVRSSTIATMGLYGDLEVAVGITQSCIPVGSPHFITGADDYVLVELDGRPAVTTFIEQSQALGVETFQEAAQDLLFGFPLDPENPSFAGERCVVRPLAGVDRDSKGLVIPYPLQEQTTVGFMHRSANNAEQDMERMVAGVAEQLSGAPDFGIYFDCAARGQRFYGRTDVDIGKIRERLGDFPLIGMFGGFELATALGLPHVYTYTGVLVAVRERA